MNLSPDFLAELRRSVDGEVRADLAARILYSTDASIYEIPPLGVVFPRTRDDLHAVVSVASKHNVPILARGSGTSLAGQAIGPALIVDCSRWLNRIVQIDPEARTAVVEPGVLLSNLNRALEPHGLQFGPDPASAERATIGGVIGNNATGAHSICYGMTADHLEQADVILSDGSQATLGEVDAAVQGSGPIAHGSLAAQIVEVARGVAGETAEAIRTGYPRTWRNSAGYRLNYIVPWSASRPPEWSGERYPPVAEGKLNMASVLAGSEGTLAVIQAATLRLVRKPKCSVLAILEFESNSAACDAVPALLSEHPSAIELIPRLLIRLASARPGYASQLGWARGDPAALLAVEFSGDSPRELVGKARQVAPGGLIAESLEDQANIWAIRRLGLGILDSRPAAARPIAFIEDCAIPVESLGRFVREVEGILRAPDVEAGFYAHASAGCLHIRPILDLRRPEGRQSLRAIATATVEVALSLGGSMSSEHGDGIARGEWLKRTYGPELILAMRRLKQIADPRGLLNPEKMLDAPPMDTHLRAWMLSPQTGGARSRPFAGIEQCNGQGLCRKETGLMCPSFQATRDEMHSTRGRANLLRALMLGAAVPGARGAGTEPLAAAAKEALDLCLGCQGCRAECPSGVNMPKFKAEFENEYFRTHPRPIRDLLLGYLHLTAPALATLAPVVRAVWQRRALRRLAAKATGLTSERELPRFSRAKRIQERGGRSGAQPPDVIFLSDAFGRYGDPGPEADGAAALQALGLRVAFLPATGTGAALMAKSLVEPARRHARAVLRSLERLDPAGSAAIVGVEPAEVYALRHDYADWLPELADLIGKRAPSVWLIEEYLVRHAGNLEARLPAQTEKTRIEVAEPVYFHPHCHQRSQAPAADGLPYGVEATREVLNRCGYDVRVTDAGCCGMAGTFGFEAEHYELSMKVGEMTLFPAIRKLTPDGRLAHRAAGVAQTFAATGAACRMHILHGTGVQAVHPISLVRRRLGA